MWGMENSGALTCAKKIQSRRIDRKGMKGGHDIKGESEATKKWGKYEGRTSLQRGCLVAQRSPIP